MASGVPAAGYPAAAAAPAAQTHPAAPSAGPAAPAAKRHVVHKEGAIDASLTFLGLLLYFFMAFVLVIGAIMSGWLLKHWVKNGNIKGGVGMEWRPIQIAR